MFKNNYFLTFFYCDSNMPRSQPALNPGRKKTCSKLHQLQVFLYSLTHIHALLPKTSLEMTKGMERSFAIHLAATTKIRMLRLSLNELEPIIETRLQICCKPNNRTCTKKLQVSELLCPKIVSFLSTTFPSKTNS